MPQRRSYSKVRGGCLTCKERKVRCSLERPICKNCSKLCRQCSYAAPESKHKSVEAPSRCETCRGRPADEVQLMYHYTAYTYLTISDNPILTSLWKEVVPKHAFRYRFLLQGLLALAAYHKLQNQIDSPTDLIDAADLYQQEALSSYIGLLSSITEENCHAMFAFSQVIVAISYCRLNLDLIEETEDQQGLITGVIEIFKLLRGTLAIAEKASVWLRAGDLAPMMGDRPQPQPANSFATRNPCIEALSMLSDHISSQMQCIGRSESRVETLILTIQLLYTMFLGDYEPFDRLNKIVGLPVFFDANFISLLRARDHASLVVLSYYGVALHQLQHAWAFVDIGAKIVQATASIVGPEWSPYLERAQTEVQMCTGQDDVHCH